MKPNQRLLSLDALRGFDMLFIMGFSGLVASLCALWPGASPTPSPGSMGHAAWDGLTHHDTIFPLFLFIAGVSFPFSLAKQRANGLGERAILGKVIRRGVTLVVLGLVYNGLFRLRLRVAARGKRAGPHRAGVDVRRHTLYILRREDAGASWPRPC